MRWRPAPCQPTCTCASQAQDKTGGPPLTLKKIIATAALAATTVAATSAVVPTAQAHAATGVKPCGASRFGRVWVGSKTSCAISRATLSAVVGRASGTGETRSSITVRSPANHRRHRLFLNGSGRHGSTPVGVWRAAGDDGSAVRVEFWIP